VLPPLEECERKPANGKVVKLRDAQQKGSRIADRSSPDAWRPSGGTKRLAEALKVTPVM
jgi:hypothetical protein